MTEEGREALDAPSKTQLSLWPNPRVPYRVIAETADFIVVFKPAGVVTAPGVGHERNALLNGLFARFGKELQNLGKSRDFGLLHRLDRETSGLVVVGRSCAGYDALRQAFEERKITKIYIAGVASAPKAQEGVIALPIREARVAGQKRALLTPGPHLCKAKTIYRVISKSSEASLLHCTLETGRLHQIRAHCAAIGCPVLGDHVYGKKGVADSLFSKKHRRIFLQAAVLGFADPKTGRALRFTAALEPELLDFLPEIGLKSSALKQEGLA